MVIDHSALDSYFVEMGMCINKEVHTLLRGLLFVYVTRLAIGCSQICKLFGFCIGEGIKRHYFTYCSSAPC